MIAKGEKLSDRVKEFIERETRDESNIAFVHHILGIEEMASKAMSDLQPEIRKLIMRVEAGELLLGGCATCPKFYIEKDTRE
ncbi:hypothetical protein MUP37_01960 [Candidatus Bathyarchaeota archaeon]|nr:hypothetical protein [Candidatus Bathyarchaeota archaeon]